jgi:lambda family phage portal protein
MLYNQHPGDVTLRGGLESSLVDAKDIRHTFRADRPGQSRGVTWAAPIIVRLRNLDEYEDAQQVRQKLAACYTAFVREDSAGAGLPSKTSSQDVLPQTLTVGTIERLGPGESIEFADPPQVSGYSEYTTAMLRSIASGYGITYESLTNDLSGVNFSSGRMGWLEMHRNIESWRWHMLIPQFCDGLWEWFLEAARLMGARTDGIAVEWTPPRREMINPVEETRAIKDAVRAGFMSWPEALRQQGYDPDAVLKEISEHNKKLDEQNIDLDSDPRKMTAQGQKQQSAAGKSPANDNNQQGKAAA